MDGTSKEEREKTLTREASELSVLRTESRLASRRIERGTYLHIHFMYTQVIILYAFNLC